MQNTICKEGKVGSKVDIQFRGKTTRTLFLLGANQRAAERCSRFQLFRGSALLLSCNAISSLTLYYSTAFLSLFSSNLINLMPSLHPLFLFLFLLLLLLSPTISNNIYQLLTEGRKRLPAWEVPTPEEYP